MKKFVIGALICLNLVLVAVLVFHSTSQTAFAQQRNRQTGDYIVSAFQFERNNQGLYVIDTGNSTMGVFVLDTTGAQWRWKPLPPRDLTRDFPSQGR